MWFESSLIIGLIVDWIFAQSEATALHARHIDYSFLFDVSAIEWMKVNEENIRQLNCHHQPITINHEKICFYLNHHSNNQNDGLLDLQPLAPSLGDKIIYGDRSMLGSWKCSNDSLSALIWLRGQWVNSWSYDLSIHRRRSKFIWFMKVARFFEFFFGLTLVAGQFISQWNIWVENFVLLFRMKFVWDHGWTERRYSMQFDGTFPQGKWDFWNGYFKLTAFFSLSAVTTWLVFITQCLSLIQPYCSQRLHQPKFYHNNL